jgi:RNA polymerase sigma factor (sigma-70 family)
MSGSASDMPPPSDEQFAKMVERAQTGDGKAISSFIEHFERQLRGFIRNDVGDDQVAQDLYSEVIEKVWKALPKTDERLRQPPAAKKWIFTIATHLIFDYFKVPDHSKTISLEEVEERSRAGDMSAAKDWGTVEQLISIPSAEEVVCSIEEHIEQQKLIKEQQRLIAEALRKVPGQLGTCFRMRYVKGFPHREIARALGISESAARAYSSRGRQAVIKVVAQLSVQQEGRI